jgi:membrane protein insertase Oxa1/YidC/SpoIIIJ
MNDVSLFRLYVLRGTYLLLVVGIAFTIWPQLLNHPTPWSLWHGVGCSLLGAIGLLALLGIRYPLKMLPLLFFELVWKIIWIIAVAIPLWESHQMDAENLETAQNCMMGIIMPLVIPWRYVMKEYIRPYGDRWK